MKKQDLRNGMLVQYANGKVRMFVKDTPFGDLLIGVDGWEMLEWYRDDLTHIQDIALTVMAVFEPQFPRDCMPKYWQPSENIIWKRKKGKPIPTKVNDDVILDMVSGKILTVDEFFDFLDKLIDNRATYRD